MESYDLSRNLGGDGLVTPLNSSPNASKYLEQLRESRTKLMNIAKSYQKPRPHRADTTPGRIFDIADVTTTHSGGRISIPALLIRQGEKIEAMKQHLFQAQAAEQQLAMKLRTAEIENGKLHTALEQNLQKYEQDAADAHAARQSTAEEHQRYLATLMDDLQRAKSKADVLSLAKDELQLELEQERASAETAKADAMDALKASLTAEHRGAMRRLEDQEAQLRHSLADQLKIAQLEKSKLGQDLAATTRKLDAAKVDFEQDRQQAMLREQQRETKLHELEQAQAGFTAEVARLNAQLNGANQLAQSRADLLDQVYSAHQAEIDKIHAHSEKLVGNLHKDNEARVQDAEAAAARRESVLREEIDQAEGKIAAAVAAAKSAEESLAAERVRSDEAVAREALGARCVAELKEQLQAAREEFAADEAAAVEQHKEQAEIVLRNALSAQREAFEEAASAQQVAFDEAANVAHDDMKRELAAVRKALEEAHAVEIGELKDAAKEREAKAKRRIQRLNDGMNAVIAEAKQEVEALNARHLAAMAALKEEHDAARAADAQRFSIELAEAEQVMLEQQRLALEGLSNGLQEKHDGEVKALEAAVVAACNGQSALGDADGDDGSSDDGNVVVELLDQKPTVMVAAVSGYTADNDNAIIDAELAVGVDEPAMEADAALQEQFPDVSDEASANGEGTDAPSANSSTNSARETLQNLLNRAKKIEGFIKQSDEKFRRASNATVDGPDAADTVSGGSTPPSSDEDSSVTRERRDNDVRDIRTRTRPLTRSLSLSRSPSPSSQSEPSEHSESTQRDASRSFDNNSPRTNPESERDYSRRSSRSRSPPPSDEHNQLRYPWHDSRTRRRIEQESNKSNRNEHPRDRDDSDRDHHPRNEHQDAGRSWRRSVPLEQSKDPGDGDRGRRRGRERGESSDRGRGRGRDRDRDHDRDRRRNNDRHHDRSNGDPRNRAEDPDSSSQPAPDVRARPKLVLAARTKPLEQRHIALQKAEQEAKKAAEAAKKAAENGAADKESEQNPKSPKGDRKAGSRGRGSGNKSVAAQSGNSSGERNSNNVKNARNRFPEHWGPVPKKQTRDRWEL